VNPSWVNGVAANTRQDATVAICRLRGRPAWRMAGTSPTRGSRCLGRVAGIASTTTTVKEPPAAGEVTSDVMRRTSTSLRAGQLADREKLTVTGGLRYGLASPPWRPTPQVAPSVSLGERFKVREEMRQRRAREHAAPIQFVLAARKTERRATTTGQNNFRARISVAWSPTTGSSSEAATPWSTTDRPRPRADLRRSGLVCLHTASPARTPAPTRTTPR